MAQEYVLGFMFNQIEQYVVLIKKRQGILNGVGGKVKPKEWPIVAMAREFKEETGLLTNPNDWHLFLTLEYENGDKVHILKAIDNKAYYVTQQTDEKPIFVRIEMLYKDYSTQISPDVFWMIHMLLDKRLSNTYNRLKLKEEIKPIFEEGNIMVTEKLVESKIVTEEYINFKNSTLTICRIVLTNGFEVIGTSACVIKANFSEDLGRKLARKKAVDKIWGLEGYLLAEKINKEAVSDGS